MEIVKRPVAREFTTKQMGDACEMLVAAELTLAGVPALKTPDSWPHYDVIAHPRGERLQKISVKARRHKAGGSHFVEYSELDDFDWLAVVILHEDNNRAIYIIPRDVADKLATYGNIESKQPHARYYRIDKMDELFFLYRDNFRLRP